jgi:integrase/recombinase XerD
MYCTHQRSHGLTGGRQMKNQITFSQAIEGYLLHANARHLSSHTIADYTNTFRKFQAHLDQDPPLASITADHVRAFFTSLDVSNKTILNYHTGLSALWTWATAEDLISIHILRRVARPKPETRAIVPFTRADVEALLNACNQSRPYTRPGKRQCTHARPTADRDKAIILLLIDTGLRASELCSLTLNHIHLKNRHLVVNGKGAKERILPFSARTAQAIWRYLNQRPPARGNTTRVFISETGNPISRHALLRLITRLGRRAGVPNAHTHRFRHTFAIQFLRNGGNAYVLQSLLGHSTMEMVKVYLQLAQHDLEENHNRASPVDNWAL